MTELSSTGPNANVSVPARSAWALTATAFSVMVVDGFDTAAISYVAPTLALKWQVSPSSLGPAFVMTSIGAVLGYLASGFAVCRFGRRLVVAVAMACFSILSFASVLASSVWEMAVLRLFTAFFLGLVVPAIIAGVSMAVSEARRSRMTATVATGMSVGAAAGGAISAILIERLNWESVFVIGGVLPLILLPAVFRNMRDDLPLGQPAHQDLSAQARVDLPPASMRSLFRSPYRYSTALIGGISCLGFFVAYALLFWMPTLLTSFGFSPASAALGTMAVSAGGGLGSLLLIASARKFSVEGTLILLLIVGVPCFAIMGTVPLHGNGVVLFFSTFIGAATGTICIGQSVLAVRAYPLSLRTTGVGFASAAGRAGAIFGPGAVGALVSSGMRAQEVLLWCVVPCAALIGLLILLKTRSRLS